MAADTQPRRSICELHSLGEGLTVRHERGRGNDALSMRLDNGAIHARRKTEVVRVDDQPPQGASLAGGRNSAGTIMSSRGRAEAMGDERGIRRDYSNTDR